MFRSIIITILLVCSLSFTAFAYPSQHSNYPPRNHHNDRNARYSVYVSSSGRGYVSPRGRITVRRGQTVHISIRPVKGYFVRKVTINGRYAGRSHSYTLRHINRNQRVHVEFARDYRGSHRPHH